MGIGDVNYLIQEANYLICQPLLDAEMA